MNISSSGKPDQIRKLKNHVLLQCSCNHVLKIAVGGIGLGPNPGSDSARATRTDMQSWQSVHMIVKLGLLLGEIYRASFRPDPPQSVDKIRSGSFLCIEHVFGICLG